MGEGGRVSGRGREKDVGNGRRVSESGRVSGGERGRKG